MSRDADFTRHRDALLSGASALTEYARHFAGAEAIYALRWSRLRAFDG